MVLPPGRHVAAPRRFLDGRFAVGRGLGRLLGFGVGRIRAAARHRRPGVTVVERRIGERVGTAGGFGADAAGLRAGRGTLAAAKGLDQLRRRFGRQVFVKILVDLEHRRVGAGAEAFDLGPGEHAVGGRRHLRRADQLLADGHHVVGAAQRAGRRGADLEMEFADRGEIEHRVEGRDLQHADERHVEAPADGLDHRMGDPAFLLLADPQRRDNRRSLAARRIFRDLLFDAREVFEIELEGGWLKLRRGETAQAHRSTSPNTMSSEPRTAETSASMWPLFM